MTILSIDKVWALSEDVICPVTITKIIDEKDRVFVVREIIADGAGHCTCDDFIAGKTCKHLKLLGLEADEIEVLGGIASDGGKMYHQFMDSVGVVLCTCYGSAYRYKDCACKHCTNLV